nr:elongation factor-like GTPase 1 [Leptinotarsa decemlineata]XP_023017056.1 elongation factor-like GTPase 1 [Leptinotarsa decemlineata]
MDSLKPTSEELKFCSADLKCIRNICILAHVDHGKTTVADILLATNRLVSKRMAGLRRYLDDRPDEQKRGITMKSSAVSLLNVVNDEDGKNKRILLNMIDTPGHIDFSTEVGAALRVCDGAIILVDLVEGVCVQTRESIRRAFEEHTRMILVLNKFDRLVVELRKDIDDIFQCILRVLEGCNAIVAELYQYEYINNEVDIEDTGLLFSPETGNVIFASGIDGWGFTTRQISKMFVDFVKNETVDSLNEKMWDFDFYIDSKREVKKGAIAKKKSNIFIQLCLKTVVHIYETFLIRMERDKATSVIKKLGIKNISKDMTSNDPKTQVQAILQAWQPLAFIIFLQCLKLIPSPCKIEKTKIEYLLNWNKFCEDFYLNSCVENIMPYFENASTVAETPTIVYVSKMFCVHVENLSQNRPKAFIIKPRNRDIKIEKDESQDKSNKELEKPYQQPEKPCQEQTKSCDKEDGVNQKDEIHENIVVIALARVFTGTLRVGQEIYVMKGAYLPDELQISTNPEDFVEHNEFVDKVVIKELYMLFGRELMLVDSIPAGNFCGIGGIETKVLRTATLSTILNIVPLIERPRTDPVVRHAIEPVNLKDLTILRQGLKLLMQSDSCVEVIMQETGELVLLTAGDVHLEKCLEDLKNIFTGIEVHVSSPMVSLRETILQTSDDFKKDVSKYESMHSTHFVLSVIAVSLPENIRKIIQNNHELLKTVEDHRHRSFIDIAKQCFGKKTESTEACEKTFKSEITRRNLSHVKEELKTAFTSGHQCWFGLHENIWSVGGTSNCLNVLINDTSNYKRNIFTELNGTDKRALFDHCILKAFNSICKAGPICEESLSNCAFIVSEFEMVNEVYSEDISPQSTSVVESSVRETFKKAFEKQEQRLMEPMYITEIQVNINILGRVYSVVNRRHGKILENVGMDEQEKVFLVKAQIPVIESEGFANEMRKTTSGQANPTLRFSHYEILNGDPFYEPIEEDEEDETINVENSLRANKLRKDVRRRKGLQVEDEVVIHAEKQRTLNKKK